MKSQTAIIKYVKTEKYNKIPKNPRCKFHLEYNTDNAF